MFTEYCVDPTQPVHYSSHGVELAHFPVAKQCAKRVHGRLKIFNANPYIVSKTPCDQLPLVADTECCGDCVCATEPPSCLSHT